MGHFLFYPDFNFVNISNKLFYIFLLHVSIWYNQSKSSKSQLNFGCVGWVGEGPSDVKCSFPHCQWGFSFRTVKCVCVCVCVCVQMHDTCVLFCSFSHPHLRVRIDWETGFVWGHLFGSLYKAQLHLYQLPRKGIREQKTRASELSMWFQFFPAICPCLSG